MTIASINDLTRSADNPRGISDEAAAGLAASLRRFGDIAGVVYNQRSKRLVCGHQRVNQLRAMGAKVISGEPPQIKLPSGDAFPVRVVDWDEATEAAANVAANNPNTMGHFTSDLQSLLEDLQGKFDGFESLNLDSLLLPPQELPLGLSQYDEETGEVLDDGNGADYQKAAEQGEEQAPDVDIDAEGREPGASSQVRMVQLFLNTESFPVFDRQVKELAERYGTTNATDTVMEAIGRAYAQSED